MEYRPLGRSGLKVSVAGLGTAPMGRQCDAAQSAAIVDRAISLGVNFLDTADSYGRGLSEEYTGRAIRGRRQDLVIATKFERPMRDGPLGGGASRRYVMEAVQASLRRLGVDYVDLYQIHFWDPTTPLEETLRALEDLVRGGYVRYVGCSNFAAWQIVEAQWIARTDHLSPLISAQCPYNLLDRAVEADLVPVCERYGLGMLPYFPLAGGFLAGRYRPGQAIPAASRLGSALHWDRTSDSHVVLATHVVNDANHARLAALERWARARGRGVGELALAWLASRPQVPSVIAGATTPEQVAANVQAVTWQLTPDDLADLDRALQEASALPASTGHGV
jgi:aryl-alcohol dehydrogenase-like predicted oxidoreductase